MAQATKITQNQVVINCSFPSQFLSENLPRFVRVMCCMCMLCLHSLRTCGSEVVRS